MSVPVTSCLKGWLQAWLILRFTRDTFHNMTYTSVAVGKWGTLGHTTMLPEALRVHSARNNSGADAVLGLYDHRGEGHTVPSEAAEGW